jgi:hypothetical protein
MSTPMSHHESCGLCHSDNCQHVIQAQVEKWLQPDPEKTIIKMPHHLEFRRADFAIAALAASNWDSDEGYAQGADLIMECWRIADAMIEEGKRRERERQESGL